MVVVHQTRSRESAHRNRASGPLHVMPDRRCRVEKTDAKAAFSKGVVGKWLAG
jgi:hypothetical protein